VLSADELAAFATNGWVGPFPLLSAREVELAGEARDASIHLFRSEAETSGCRAPDAFAERLWFKSLHARVPLFAEIAARPAIVERLTPLLGADVMLWGTSVTVREPDQVHRWHVDVEHRMWPGVTAFIGLQNTTLASTLKVISGSHRFAAMPQELGVRSDGDAVAAAKRLGLRDAAITEVDLNAGDFFIFDGTLWHGSQNRGATTRMALLTQYARPDVRVAIPISWNHPFRWHSSRPPCLMVSGTDRFGINAT
jgi:non-heme Fe2+,alpha-ketoglutarate-dependent halogenase